MRMSKVLTSQTQYCPRLRTLKILFYFIIMPLMIERRLFAQNIKKCFLFICWYCLGQFKLMLKLLNNRLFFTSSIKRVLREEILHATMPNALPFFNVTTSIPSCSSSSVDTLSYYFSSKCVEYEYPPRWRPNKIYFSHSQIYFSHSHFIHVKGLCFIHVLLRKKRAAALLLLDRKKKALLSNKYFCFQKQPKDIGYVVYTYNYTKTFNWTRRRETNMECWQLVQLESFFFLKIAIC